jgi:hypothetical protein
MKGFGFFVVLGKIGMADELPHRRETPAANCLCRDTGKETLDR